MNWTISSFSQVSDQLVAEAQAFAQELSDLVASVVVGVVDPFEVIVSDPHVIVRQRPADAGIVMSANGINALRLFVSFRCTWDSRGQYLAVNESKIQVSPHGSSEPLYRYDYDAECDGNVPAAHINVHGHRDDFVFALMTASRQHRGKARESWIRKGRVPSLATFHLPVGGHRFRPSLEDVLEVTIREFDIDAVPGWEDVVRTGRMRWREKQLRAAVRDDPASAAEVLRSLGFEVTAPEELPALRVERTGAL